MTSQDRIIRSAIKLFGERGYEATSLKDIGGHAGHAAGLITHHFKTKAALFVTCGVNVLDEFIEELEKAVKPAENGMDMALAFADGFIRFALERRSAYLVLVKLSPFSVSRPELTSEELVWKMSALIGVLHKSLERGIEDGSIQPVVLRGESEPLDLETYTLTAFSTIMGAARTLVLSPYARARQQEATIAVLRRSLKPMAEGQP